MPLKLNVGAAKKIGEPNYGSRGASVNLELELDSSLVGDPHKLQERIRQMFSLVRASLAEELNGHVDQASREAGTLGTPPTPASRSNDKGNAGPEQRQATPSQIKALFSIARTQRLDLYTFLKEQFNVNRPEDLTLRQASQAIDALKAHSGR